MKIFLVLFGLGMLGLAASACVSASGGNDAKATPNGVTPCRPGFYNQGTECTPGDPIESSAGTPTAQPSPTAMPTQTSAPTDIPTVLQIAGWDYITCYSGPEESIALGSSCSIPLAELNSGGYDINPENLEVKLVNPNAIVPGTNVVAQQFDVTAKYDPISGTGVTKTEVYIILSIDGHPDSFAIREGTQMAARQPTALELTVQACTDQAKAGNAKLAIVNTPKGGSLGWLTGRGDVSGCYLQGGQGGASLYDSLEAAIYDHMAEQDSKIIRRDASGNPLGPDQIQPGTAKLFMNGDAPVINGTYIPELRAEDVGLPWNNNTLNGASVSYKPCYVNTTTMFHAGDIWNFLNLKKDQVINIVAPMSGTVVYADYTSDAVGQNIIIQSDYSFNGEKVYYQIVHFSRLSVSVGRKVERGDILGALVNSGIFFGSPDGTPPRFIDFGVYHTSGSWKYVDASSPAHIIHYIDVGTLIVDDHAILPNLYKETRCSGNPK